MAETKLTRPQWFLLADIANGPEAVSDTYAPAKKLIALGYAELVQVKYGAILRITDAGRLALRQAEGQG